MDYDAATPTDRRKPSKGKISREEVVLPQKKREVVTSGVRDLTRNLSIVPWAVRKHLDYNTQFNLQGQSGNEEFDEQFEAFFSEISSAAECDASGRYCFDSMLRMIEASAVLDGDCGVLKLANGRIQGIESDLIRNPDGAEGTWFNGVKTNAVNSPVAYGLWRRGDNGTGYKYDRTIPAENLFLHGYFSRFDQCRGVSPLASAANDFQDFYEGKDLALAKLKVQQFFAIAFYRDAIEGTGDTSGGDVDDEGNETSRSGYAVDFGKGPAQLDLSDGDRAEFLEGSTPATSTQDFMMLVCQIALKSLDIPFSFFNESFTNFFGSRSAWIHYERSCDDKQKNLIRFADNWLRWRVAIAIQSGRLVVPPDVLAAAGEGIARPWWEFVPRGVPWWDPNKEVDAAARSVKEGFSSRSRVCRQGGTDFWENIRLRAKEEAFAKKLGVSLGEDDGVVAAAGPVDVAKSTEGDSPGPVEGEAAAVPLGGDIQAAALNGAQVTSLLLIADKLSLKQIPLEAARALIKASFPATPEQLIDTIVTTIASHDRPAEPAPAPGPSLEKKAPTDGDASGDDVDGSEAGEPSDS